MREGWEGAWAWQNRYTTESSPSAYLFMFWILLGHLAAILHLPLIAVFHLARVGAAFALMGSAWLVISHFIEDRSARRLAFFFVAIGLGMGLVIQALGHPVIFAHQTDTLDLRMPELTAFYSVLALPHFAWSGVFAGVGAALTLKAIQRGSLGLAALAGVAWLGQASIHPQMPILMGGATALALPLRPATRGDASWTRSTYRWACWLLEVCTRRSCQGSGACGRARWSRSRMLPSPRSAAPSSCSPPCCSFRARCIR